MELDDSWRTEARARSGKLFPNQGLQPLAHLMASAHRYAIDYIEQAPVIVVAASRGQSPRRPNERSYLAGQIAEFCRRGDTLKQVMKAYDLPLPMRKIKGGALTPTRWPLIYRLSRIAPSTLSQIIPDTVGAQMMWMRGMDKWLEKMAVRHYQMPSLLFEWAAINLRDLPYGQQSIGSDLADFAAHNKEKFNERWNRAQAEAAQEQWHLSLAKRSNVAKMMADAGVAFDTAIDYSPLPLSTKVKDLTFTALQTGEELFVEGSAMRHCVASYINRVVAGQSRVFSVRHGGKRIATLELKPSGTTEGRSREVINERGYKFIVREIVPSFYALAQLKGPCNANPNKRVRDIVSEFISIANGE